MRKGEALLGAAVWSGVAVVAALSFWAAATEITQMVVGAAFLLSVLMVGHNVGNYRDA